MSNIKYSKDITWLKPFVESACEIVNIKSIKSIKSYKVKKGLNEQQYASIIKENNKYSINLLTHEWDKNSKKYIATTLSLFLETLAHELAHTKVFIHNYKHFKLESLILLRFSYIIKKLNIKDTSVRINSLDIIDERNK